MGVKSVARYLTLQNQSQNLSGFNSQCLLVMCIPFQFVHQKQLKWQKQARADLHYQKRLLSVVMSSWKVRCFGS